MQYRLICLGIAVSALLTAADAPAPILIDEIVCKVNGDIITRNDLEQDRKDLEAELRRQGLSGQRLTDELATAQKNALRERIDRLLLIQKGKELDLKVDAEVTKAIAEKQRQTKIADPDKFQQLVREQTGKPFEEFKSDIKDQLLMQGTVRQEVTSKINFKREELEQYYNDHKAEFQREERVFLSEILISTADKDSTGLAAAEKKAKDLVARARKGEKFSELAQSNSDALSAQDGGQMPPFQKGQLRSEIETAVWNQPRGYVTDPIKVDSGFLIYKVEDHQKAGLADFEEVRGEVSEKLFKPRLDPELRAYLTKLRQNAFLEIKRGYEDAGAAPNKNTTWVDPAQLTPQTVKREELAEQTRRKHILGLIPIPGTSTQNTGTSSSR